MLLQEKNFREDITRIQSNKSIKINAKVDNDAFFTYFRNDDFWKNNFMTIHKLRQKDKSEIKYVDLFSEKLKTLNHLRNNMVLWSFQSLFFV